MPVSNPKKKSLVSGKPKAKMKVKGKVKGKVGGEGGGKVQAAAKLHKKGAGINSKSKKLKKVKREVLRKHAFFKQDTGGDEGKEGEQERVQEEGWQGQQLHIESWEEGLEGTNKEVPHEGNGAHAEGDKQGESQTESLERDMNGHAGAEADETGADAGDGGSEIEKRNMRGILEKAREMWLVDMRDAMRQWNEKDAEKEMRFLALALSGERRSMLMKCLGEISH